MKALAATESDFQDFVLNGESAIAEQIVGDAGLRRDRLGIYFDAYRGGCIRNAAAECQSATRQCFRCAK